MIAALTRTRPARIATSIGAILAGAAANLAITASPAHADGGNGSTALSPFDITDSRGIKISQYQLSIDGGGMTNPGKTLWAWPLQLAWEVYRWGIGCLAWLVDWVIGFSWLPWLSKPFAALGSALKLHLIDPGYLVAGFASIGAFVLSWWFFKGRYASGLTEMFISCLILALGGGLLANPVGLVTGQDGPLERARSGGVEVANLMTSGGQVTSSDPSALKANTSGMITDTFIRVPHQLINYNAVIDSDAKCVGVYDKALRGGPYKGDDDAARSMLGRCNKAYKEYADNPNASQLITVGAVMVSAMLLGLFAVLLSILLFVAVLMALYEAVKLIINLVIGVIPGSSRGGLIDGVANLAVMVLAVFSMTVMLGAYLFVVRSAIAHATGVPPLVRFALADLVLVAGVFILWRLWRAHHRAADNMRNRLRKLAAPKASVIARPSASARVTKWATAQPRNAQHRELLDALGAHSAADALSHGAGGSRTSRGMSGRGSGRVRGGTPGRITSVLNQTNAGHSLVLAGQAGRGTGKTVARVGKLAYTTGKLGVAATAGGPVFWPKVAGTAKKAVQSKAASAGARVATKSQAVHQYGKTWLQNSKAAGQGIGRGVEATTRPVRTGAVVAAQPVRRAAERRYRPLDPDATHPTAPRLDIRPSGPRRPMPSPPGSGASDINTSHGLPLYQTKADRMRDYLTPTFIEPSSNRRRDGGVG